MDVETRSPTDHVPPTSLMDEIETVASLTSREAEVAALLAVGLGNKEIGRTLHIAVDTVKEHVHNLLGKSGLNGRQALAVWWTLMEVQAAIDRVVPKTDDEWSCYGTRSGRAAELIGAKLDELRGQPVKPRKPHAPPKA